MSLSIFENEDSKDEKDISSLTRLLFNPNIVKLASILIAKLEYIRYDETRRGVFRTQWGNDLFKAGFCGLNTKHALDIDNWFSSIVLKHPPERLDKFQFSPSKFNQTVDTNWIYYLLETERENPGFMILLHNCLEIEDESHKKIAEKSKVEQEYDFFEVGHKNRATQQLLGHQTASRMRIT